MRYGINNPMTMQDLVDSPAEANDSNGSVCRISDEDNAEHLDVIEGGSSSIG